MEFYQLIEKILMTSSRIIREEKEKLIEKEDLDNIAYGHFVILDHISQQEKPTITSLAKSMDMTKPTLTVHIQKMEKIGLVYKEKSTEDRRVSYIRLSEMGKRIESAEWQAFKRMEESIQQKLTYDEQVVFAKSLQKLIMK